MKPRDWFSLGLRFVGVYALYDAFSQLVGYAGARLGVTTGATFSVEQADRAMHYALLWAVSYSALGVLLVFSADWITRLAYNESSATAETNNELDNSVRNPPSA